MGEEIQITCKSCNYSDSFTIGVGMLYSDLKNVIDLIHYKRRDIVLDILENHKIKFCDFGHEVYTCSKCNNLYSRFYVEIDYDEDKKYLSKFKCNRCKTELTKLKDSELENPLNLPCPKCKNISLEQSPTMLWD